MATPNEPQSSAADNNQPDNNGSSEKMVPEKDLVAVRQSLESKAAESDNRLKDAEAKLAEAQAALEQERTGRQSVEEKAKKVEELEKSLEETKTSLESTQAEHTKLLNQTKSDKARMLVENYHLSKDKVDSMSLDQMDLFLDTLPAPNRHNPNHYGLTGGGAGGDVSSLSSREKIKSAL